MTALRRASDAGESYFLGVRKSVRGRAWVDRLGPSGANLATAISQRFELPEILGRVLAAGGATLDNVPMFLNPTLKALMPDPSALRDMDKAASRLADAIERCEAVAIFGDYDVDGAVSSALLKRFFAVHGLDARIYIPDRIGEGYGPNPAAIGELASSGAGLIVTVDCGTTSHAALAAAAPHGTAVIVVDHHQADAELPDVHAVVNPNRQDDLSGLGDLAAAGVTFLLMVATLRVLRERGYYSAGAARPEPSPLEWLDLVALATVCDVVPLKGLNRAYVTQGLKIMRMRSNPGLRALADAAGLKSPPTSYHLGFVLGPRINAGGRIGDAGLGARLLSTGDADEADRIAALLDRLNRERKAMETEILERALLEAEEALEADPDLPILTAGSKDWHKGLVGLVASRLTERFHRPSLVISWGEGGEGTGSLRSIAGADIGSAVRAAVAEGLLVKGGGHAMAAGLTLSEDRLRDVEDFLADRLRYPVGEARAAAGLEIDGALTPASVSAELMTLLERAGPYGAGNPQPRFVFPAHRITFAKIMAGAHLRCTLDGGPGARLGAIAFRAVGTPLGNMLLEAKGMPLHVAGHLRRDNWGGRERIELMIEDAADPRRAG